jgi:peptide/nickel transport system permease protein
MKPVWHALKRRPSRLIGLCIVLLFVFMAVAGSVFYPARLPYDVDNVYAPISWQHPLSTDFEGVDVLALVITGTRGVLLVAAAAGLLTMVVGTAAGLYAGYRRGGADSVLMRVADFVLTIPGFPLLIVLTTTINLGAWWKMALVLGLVGWGGLARAVRSQTMSLRERGFIEAARGLGLSTRHIVVKELLPNVAPYIATNLLLAVTGYIYAQVGLYFLGVLPLDTSNWGVMLNAAVFQSGALISPDALPYLLAPLGAILLLTLGVVLIVDALEEIFNPRLREG